MVVKNGPPDQLRRHTQTIHKSATNTIGFCSKSPAKTVRARAACKKHYKAWPSGIVVLCEKAGGDRQCRIRTTKRRGMQPSCLPYSSWEANRHRINAGKVEGSWPTQTARYLATTTLAPRRQDVGFTSDSTTCTSQRRW